MSELSMLYKHIINLLHNKHNKNELYLTIILLFMVHISFLLKIELCRLVQPETVIRNRKKKGDRKRLLDDILIPLYAYFI